MAGGKPVAAPGVLLPAIADDNDTFTDEGTATTGWTAANASLAVTGSVLRMTKTTGSGSSGSMTKSVTMPGTNLDHIFYGKVMMARANANEAGAVWLRNSGNTRQFVLWLNYNSVSGAYAQGTLSIQAYESATLRTAVVATGVNTSTAWIEFALQYDHKWSTMNCFIKQGDGTWDLKARIACTYVAYIEAQLITLSTAPSGTWMEFDYLTICRPNLVVIGDSIAEGKTLYSPNRSLGLADYSSTWARYAELYPALRNTIVVNKGVGSETSAATLARIADATGQSPRVVFLHASTNDEVNGISLADRTDNIQDTIDAITAASGTTVLLNAMYGTSSYSGNTPSPDHRDYMTTWWTANRLGLTGTFAPLDIMDPIIDGSGFMTTGLTQADGIHPTPAGHEDIGLFIASQGYAP
jgi:lysophospholipase L1-like esterase